MRFERESYRKLYVVESPEHQLLPLVTRGLRDYLLRFAAEDGTLLAKSTDPIGDMAVILRARPKERKHVELAIGELQRVGYLRIERGRVWLPKFEEAQAARSPGALRQQRLRDKRRETGDVTSNDDNHVTDNVTRNAPIASPLIDETRRDETTTPKHPAVATAVACPGDLVLTEGQRGTLETGLVPSWAIDVITLRFVAKHGADPDDKRTIVAWRKCLSQAISGDWNDANKRPKKPENGASATIWDENAGRFAQ